MNIVNTAVAFISGEPPKFQQSSSFKDNNSFRQRRDEADRVCAKYPDCVPIICEVSPQFKEQLDLNKRKFLVPSYITVGQFMYVIRKRIKMDSSQALFIFVNNHLPRTSSMVSELYSKHADEDRFLYTLISLESTFGTTEL
jgi:GABA(A) receptor-associated protein